MNDSSLFPSRRLARPTWIRFTAGVRLMGMVLSPAIFIPCFGATLPGTTPVFAPAGGFGIDGDLRANTPTQNIGDWVTNAAGTGGFVLYSDGTPVNPASTFHVADPFNSPVDFVASGGKYYENPVTSWLWKYGNAGDKVDINHAVVHITTATNGHQWAVVSADRLSGNGDSYIDFEFLQDVLTVTPTNASGVGGFTNTAPHGGRRLNDFLVTLAFTGGGSTAEFYVQQWKTNASAGAGSFDYFTIDIASSLPSNSVFAAVNSAGSTVVPYGAFAGTTYAQNTFAEAAVDLTALIGSSFDPCTSLAVKTIVVKTKQSASRSASLGDMIAPLNVDLTLGLADAGPSQTKCAEGAATAFELSGVAHPNINSIASMSWSIVSATDGAAITSAASCTNCTALPVIVHITNAPATAILRLTVTDTAGCTKTDDVILKVNPQTTLSGLANQATCPGETASFSASTTGIGVTCQWYKGGNALNDQTGESLTLNNVSAADAGTYSVTVSGTCGQPVTQIATLIVNEVVAVSSPPENLTKCPGEVATFTVSATGSGLGYQWSKGGNPLNGQSDSSLTLNNVSASDAGTYSVTVSGACGQPVTHSAILTVNENVAISTPPVSQTKCPGDTVNFSVSATGTALSYQWSKAGNVLGGQTGTSLTLNNVSAADAGIYSVTVSGTCGQPVVVTATLTVNQNVAVSTPPVNLTKCPGATANFSVGATGPGLSYQWSKGGNPLNGQTGSSLTLNNVSASDAGTYSVTVSGTCGQPVTRNAILTVNANVAISTPPVSLTKCPGDTASFSVNATGTGLSYQWSKGGNALGGQTGTSLTLNNVSAADAGIYSVTVSGTCGQPVVVTATLTMNQNVAVSIPPMSLTKCPGDTANFSVGATGRGLSYQWSKGGNPLGGQTASSLTLNNVSASDAGTYGVTVSGTCGQPVTHSALLTVLENVAVSIPPASLTKCPGDAVNFSVGATGPGLSYQWSKGGNALNGQTGSSLTLNNVSAADAGTYSVTISGTCGQPVTHSATLTVNQNVAVPTPPVSLTKCPGDTANFSVGATGTGLSYQWFKGSSALDGQASSSLTLHNVSATDAGTYSVTVSGACGAQVTRDATLTVLDPVVIDPMLSQSACPGGLISFNAVTHGTGPFTYLWIKDGKVLPGENASMMPINSSTVLDAGSYTVVASGACTTATNHVTLTLYTPTTATVLTSQTNCFGRNATFSTAASGTGPFNYVWKKDGNVLEGATASSITIPNLKASDIGVYTVEVTGQCNTVSHSAYLAVESDGLASPASFANPTAISITDFSPANPYPSSIDVFCVPKTLTGVTVTISNLSHTYGTDLDILLLSPSGQAIMLMSDAGSSHAINDTTLVFTDAAANSVPALSPIVSGLFKPTNYGASDNIPLPAPLGPYATSLSALNGTDANGTWSLFVIDDAKVDTGLIGGGWSMVLTWEVMPPTLSAPAIQQDGSFRATLHGQAGKSYVIEGSSDFLNWVPVSTNTLNVATAEVMDLESASFTQRFYRAVYQP